jgi:hypothetical protein
MNNIAFIKLYKLFLAIPIIALFSASCVPATGLPQPTPIIQTVEVTREVTQVATHAVTSEVTRRMEVPVTNTPTPTLVQTSTPSLTPTRTRIPSITPTWEPPRVSILEHSACLYGPSPAYLFKYGLNATSWMKVIGRNEDGTWLFVKAGGDAPDWNGCWIKSTLVKFISGDIKTVPVFWIGLPYSVLYLPPQIVSASRVGDEVTIFWQPIWMTEDDYRGYLVEAWVCQGGRQVLQPVNYVSSYNDNQTMIQNKSIIAIMVIDEPGCDVASRARLYAVEKHGYTNYVMIPWPGFDLTATVTQTPTP